MNTVSFGEKGVCIDGHRIDYIKDLKLESDEHNLSKITMTFYAEVDGLDNQKPKDRYSFKNDIELSVSGKERDRKFNEMRDIVNKRMKGGE